MRHGTCHFARGRQAQRLTQTRRGALAFIHHHPQIERRESQRRDEGLQFEYRQRRGATAMDRDNDAKLHQRRCDQSCTDSTANGDPDNRQKQQVEVLRRVTTEAGENQPDGCDQNSRLQHRFGTACDADQVTDELLEANELARERRASLEA